jgi:hypothetical protein
LPGFQFSVFARSRASARNDEAPDSDAAAAAPLVREPSFRRRLRRFAT